jgi:OOP family OmpA-OmpF porin
MKKLTLCALIALSIIACKKEQATDATTTETVTDSTSANSKPETTTATNGTFDINSIKVSDKDLGTFPYLSAPDSYKYNMGDGGISKKDISDFDKEYFAVNGKLIPQEGKTVKVTIEKDKTKGSESFSTLAVDKSFNKAIADLGGVKLPTVAIPQSEIDRVGSKELYEKHYGNSIDANQLDAIKTYVIRTKDKEVWIQYWALNNESGRITILEKAVSLESKK